MASALSGPGDWGPHYPEVLVLSHRDMRFKWTNGPTQLVRVVSRVIKIRVKIEALDTTAGFGSYGSVHGILSIKETVHTVLRVFIYVNLN